MGFPGGLVGKESTYNEGDLGSIIGLRRSPGERNDYIEVFLPGQFHVQRSLVGYSSWSSKELDTTE